MTTSDPGLLAWLRGVAVGGLLLISAPGEPNPNHRPRVGRFGTYYPKPYVEWQRACQEGFSSSRHINGWPSGPLEGPLAAAVDVRIARPKRTILAHPRGDADNYAKAPLDAATKVGLWGDDAQVRLVVAQKRWTEPGEDPGVSMWIAGLRPEIATLF